MKTENKNIKLTPKQNAVINLLQNGWQLVTDQEVKGAWVCDSNHQFHINNGLFFRLVEMDLIYQSGARDHFSFILTPNGKTIKTKAVSIEGTEIKKDYSVRANELGSIGQSKDDVELTPQTDEDAVLEPESPWTILELKDGKYTNAPEPEKPVVAILRWSSGKEVPAIIKYGNWDDHSWRTVDDDSELSYNLEVIK